MSAEQRQLFHIWVTSSEAKDHTVTDEENAARLRAERSTFVAVCGDEFLAADMSQPPGQRCPRCSTIAQNRTPSPQHASRRWRPRDRSPRLGSPNPSPGSPSLTRRPPLNSTKHVRMGHGRGRRPTCSDHLTPRQGRKGSTVNRSARRPIPPLPNRPQSSTMSPFPAFAQLVALITNNVGVADTLIRQHTDDGTGPCRLRTAGGQTGYHIWPCQTYLAARHAADVLAENSTRPTDAGPLQRAQAHHVVVPSPGHLAQHPIPRDLMLTRRTQDANAHVWVVAP